VNSNLSASHTVLCLQIFLHEKELRRRHKPASPGEGARRSTSDGFGRAKSGASAGGRNASPNTQATPRLPSGSGVRLPSGGVGRVAGGEGQPTSQEGRRRTPDGMGLGGRDLVNAGGRGRVEEIDRLYRRALKAQPGHDMALQGYVGFLRTFRGAEGEKAALKLEKDILNPKHAKATLRRNYEIQPAHNRIALHHMNIPLRHNPQPALERVHIPPFVQGQNQGRHKAPKRGEDVDDDGKGGKNSVPREAMPGPGSPWAAQSASGTDMWGPDDFGPKLSPGRK